MTTAPSPARGTLTTPIGVSVGTSNGGDTSANAPLPAWPRSSNPMRIAMLGWARLSSQAKEGSGYNLNKSELARGLSMSGHSVAYLSSGMSYRLGIFGGKTFGVGRAHVALRETWGQIPCYEIRNAPNIAPAAMNFRNMAQEMLSPVTTRLVLDWLDQVNAQIVHIHSLEGFGIDVIGAIESSGRPVVVTPHNYWYACPQVDLLHQEHSVCEDYEGGRRCTDCLPGKNPRGAMRLRAFGQSLERWLGLYPADVVRKMAYGAKPLLSSLARGRFSRRWEPPMLNPEVLADPEVALGFESVGFGEPGGVDTTIRHDLPVKKGEEPIDYARSAPDQNERVLRNSDKHLVVLNNYGERRRAGLGALASASMVTPPSDYLRRVHVSMGVPEQKTRWVRLGQPHFDQINRRTRRSPFYDARPWDALAPTRPLRFAFFGTVRPNKGLEVLARAIPLVAPALRRRCHFLIRAAGNEWPFRKRLSLFPEVSVHGGYDLLHLLASGGEYDVGILSHIWLENSPLVLLENLHAGKFVLSSRLGGPPDWIVEPRPEDGVLGNGLLFPGGDERALARCIERLASGEVLVPSPREVHSVSTLQSFPAHVREVESIYAELLRVRAGVSARSASRPR